MTTREELYFQICGAILPIPLERCGLTNTNITKWIGIFISIWEYTKIMTLLILYYNGCSVSFVQRCIMLKLSMGDNQVG